MKFVDFAVSNELLFLFSRESYIVFHVIHAGMYKGGEGDEGEGDGYVHSHQFFLSLVYSWRMDGWRDFCGEQRKKNE